VSLHPDWCENVALLEAREKLDDPNFPPVAIGANRIDAIMAFDPTWPAERNVLKPGRHIMSPTDCLRSRLICPSERLLIHGRWRLSNVCGQKRD
jgi:hypothetical protein